MILDFTAAVTFVGALEESIRYGKLTKQTITLEHDVSVDDRTEHTATM